MRLIICGTIISLCSICFQTEVSVVEYENMTMPCSTKDSTSYLQGRWYRNDFEKPICYVTPSCTYTCTENFTKDFSCSFGKMNLTLINVTRLRHGEEWQCELFTTEKVNSLFVITVFVPISSVNITSPSKYQLTVIENRQISLLCSTSLGFPSASIKWYVDQQLLSDGINNTEIKNKDPYLIQVESTLTIIPTRDVNKKYIVCKANNTGFIHTSIRRTISDVHYPVSTPTYKANNILLNNTELKVIVADRLDVECESDGNPSPIISWTRSNAVITSNGALLRFINISEHDYGTYTCKASNTMLSINEKIVSLNKTALDIVVLVPPTSPLFYFFDVKYQPIDNKTVYVRRGGRHFSIACNSSGNPTPVCSMNVTNGNNCLAAFLNVSEDIDINCTVINVLNTTLSGVQYSRKWSAMSIVTMFPPEKPRILYKNAKVRTSTIRVITNSTISVTCETESYPPPDYKWKRNYGDYASNKTLVLANISVDSHGDKLTCIANNTMHVSFDETDYGNSSASIVIDVLYPPTIPVLTVNDVTLDESLKVIRGDNVSVNCSSDGNPAPMHVWQDTELNEGFALHLSSIRTNTTQTCKAKNTLNATFVEEREETSNRSLRIMVQYPPENISIEVIPESESNKHEQNKTHIRVIKGLTFNITCFAQSFPPPCKIEWKLNNTHTLPNYMQFTNVTENSTGIYTCTVFNKMFRTVGPAENGTGNMSVRLLVISIDKPEEPKNCVAVMVSHSSITMEWKPGLPGSSPQHFIISYRIQNGTDWVNETVSDNDTGPDRRTIRYTIKYLTGDTTYAIQILAKNSFGISVCNLSVKTNPIGVTKDTENLVVPIATGISVAVVIVALVLLGIFFYRRRGNKNHTRSSQVYENVGCTKTLHQPILSPAKMSSDERLYENAVVKTERTQRALNISPHISNNDYENVKTDRRKKKQSKKSPEFIPLGHVVSDGKELDEHINTDRIVNERIIPTRKEHSVVLVENAKKDEIDNSIQQQKHYSNSKEGIYGIESICIHELFAFVDGKTIGSFANEFSTLPKGLRMPCTYACKPENIKLNKYDGILPYDHSRVTLPDDPGFYINACYIDGHNKKKAYIASIGPTSDTSFAFKTFWKMLWKTNSDIIVMLTNFREITGMKNEQYWPSFETSKSFGDIRVVSRGLDEYAEYTVRTFTVTSKNTDRHVTQLHFTAWPDKGVPNNVTSLLEFRQKMKATPSNAAGPIIVHCSAGIGRTGTLIALDRLIDEGNDKKSVNVCACIADMRTQRVNMVQTLEQYAYVYKALVYALPFKCEQYSVKTLHAFMESSSDTTFTRLMQLLQPQVKSVEESDKKASSTNKHNRGNRPDADIPGDEYRVRLYLSKMCEDSDYINAVYMDSFKTEHRFLVSQTPLHVADCERDFIYMLFQEQCVCTVDMDGSITSEAKDAVTYIPPDNRMSSLGEFNILCTRIDSKPNYIIRKIKIENTGKFYCGEWVTYHFQYTGWKPDDDVPGKPCDFVEFVREVDEYANTFGDRQAHVLIHCLNAYERSGLFCYVFNLLEKMECERQVNVGNTLRQIRTRRKDTIRNAKQLKFCYQAVDAFITMNQFTEYE